MNLKLPLEVEVPDELNVDDYTLTCKQVSEWEAVYRAEGTNDHYAPSINIDLSSGSIRGEFLGKVYSDSFDVTGDYLYENLLSMAEEMSESVNKGVKKSKSQPTTFSDMVKAQRDKALKKGNVNSEGVQFADTDMEEYANDIIGFANNIINLEAEIKAEYERTSEMPRDLMQQLFNNIYSLDYYKKLLDGEYHVWLARYGIEG